MYVLDEKKVSNQYFKLPLQESRKKKKLKLKASRGKDLIKIKAWINNI